MSKSSGKTLKLNFINNFFSNPLVGIIGVIISIIGVILAIFFYISSKEIPQLTYYVHPVKSIIISSGQSSQLSVNVNDKTIDSDVTTAQIAFWNRGKKSIRSSNILKPFTIKTNPQTPILKTRIIKKSRDVVNIELDTTYIQNGVINIDWNILEQNDGGIIQIIYNGGIDVPITADAVIEGQKSIESLTFSGKIQSPSEQYSGIFHYNKQVGIIFFIAGFVTLLSSLYLIYFKPKNDIRRKPVYIIVVVSLILISCSVYFLLKGQIPGPPFGF